MKRALILALLLLPSQADAAPKVSYKKLIVHLTLGAGSYAGLAAIPHGRPQLTVALSGSGLMAGFKEGADAQAKRDTKKQAVFHALSILGGAGIAAAAWHRR